MTLIAILKVRDVTAHFRGDDPTRPIQVGVDGSRVVLALTPERAEELAQIIARGDTTESEDWLHATVDLIASRELSIDQAGGTR